MSVNTACLLKVTFRIGLLPVITKLMQLILTKLAPVEVVEATKSPLPFSAPG
jgi:hypothetical protein